MDTLQYFRWQPKHQPLIIQCPLMNTNKFTMGPAKTSHRPPIRGSMPVYTASATSLAGLKKTTTSPVMGFIGSGTRHGQNRVLCEREVGAISLNRTMMEMFGVLDSGVLYSHLPQAHK
jgi:hypothetical protein